MFKRNTGTSRVSFKDKDIEERYSRLRKELWKSRLTNSRVVSAAVVIVLGFLLIALWDVLPFIPERVPSDEEVAAALSSVYGSAEVMYVRGDAMAPSFVSGQKVFVATDYYGKNAVERGDAVFVSFKTLPQPFITRVAFVGGDSFTRTGSTFILEGSGASITLDIDDVLYKQLAYYGNTVPEGRVILLNDNPESVSSRDSTWLGLVLAESLYGKVVG